MSKKLLLDLTDLIRFRFNIFFSKIFYRSVVYFHQEPPYYVWLIFSFVMLRLSNSFKCYHPYAFLILIKFPIQFFKHKKIERILQWKAIHTHHLDPTVNILLYLLHHIPIYLCILLSIYPSILFFYAFQSELQSLTYLTLKHFSVYIIN